MTDIGDPLPVVLFVDDDPLSLAAMHRAMHTHRHVYCTDYASTGADALDRVRRGRVDVVVTDIVMPGMDGFELMQELQSDPVTRAIPVIAMTGHGEKGARARAIEIGAADLLSKPIDHQELLARLNSVLRLRAFQERIEDQNRLLADLLEKRTEELLLARLDMLWKLSIVAETRDDCTGQHIARVGCISRAIAAAMGLPSLQVEMIAVTAPLHDIGKIGIPDSILLKPGPFSDAERRRMQAHCRIGAQILTPDDRARRVYRITTGRTLDGAPNALIEETLAVARDIALYHHERWDGAGYPMGLSGQDIPLCARIVAVADVYDALRSLRPYKDPVPMADAVKMMHEQAGKHFDPAVFDAFRRALPSMDVTLSELQEVAFPARAEAA